MNYAKAVKVARAISGLQQQELAEAAGLDPSYLSLIEVGKRRPSVTAIEKIARGLGIPSHLLMLLASEPEDLKGVDAAEITRASESLARLLIHQPSTPKGRKPRKP